MVSIVWGRGKRYAGAPSLYLDQWRSDGNLRVWLLPQLTSKAPPTEPWICNLSTYSLGKIPPAISNPHGSAQRGM